MNQKYEVLWAGIAEQDLVNIIKYIAEENPDNGEKVFERIRESVAKLNRFPERGRIVPELSDQGINLYRELVVNPWRIIYRISEKIVYVLLVFDGRQNAEDILLKILIKF